MSSWICWVENAIYVQSVQYRGLSAHAIEKPDRTESHVLPTTVDNLITSQQGYANVMPNFMINNYPSKP